MIRYALRCPEGHSFESWFKSSDAYTRLRAAAHVLCPECGSSDVDKALMTPDVNPARSRASVTPPVGTHALAAPASPAEAALVELRRQVQDNSEYVGKSFAREARRIYLGEAKERSIYGEASREDANQLVEDGIPVAPLPFVPTRKAN